MLAALTFYLYYALSKGIPVPLVTGYRIATLVLAFVGIAMCAIGSGPGITNGGTYSLVAGVLGGVSFVLILFGLVTGSKVAFLMLTITILLLWALATVRHILGA
jgi:EamA domain-containing membrane protein RarD